MDRAWILIGMMGVGKSTIGSLVAEEAERSHYDTDRMLQNKLGRSISQLFSVYGEEAFREHETSILRDLHPGNMVISTGGGIVTREANWTEMHRLGITIFLKVPPEVLIERLSASKKKRPLLQVDNWEERLKVILDQRMPLYNRADITIELGDQGIEESAAAILAEMRGRT